MFRAQPPKPKPHLPHILRVKSGQTVQARLAGDPVRALTHYFKGRTHPCLQPYEHGCPLCDVCGSARYYAYWPISGSTGLTAAVELTQLAELQLQALLDNTAPPIGTLLTFHRPGGRRNNPVEVSLPATLPHNDHDRKTQIAPIPPEQIQATLCRLWDCPPPRPAEPVDEYVLRIRPALYDRYAHLVNPNRPKN